MPVDARDIDGRSCSRVGVVVSGAFSRGKILNGLGIICDGLGVICDGIFRYTAWYMQIYSMLYADIGTGRYTAWYRQIYSMV
jgi:hypothetical protein